MAKLTQEEFILRASVIHHGKYGYKYVDYKNNHTPVDIECYSHGIFKQSPLNHLMGKGCMECYHESRRVHKYGIGIMDLPKPCDKDIAYRPWNHMMNRCYNKEYQRKMPTYVGCQVCNEWLRASVFKEWMLDTANGWIEGYELDKDLFSTERKIYSPQTCCFLPKEINIAIRFYVQKKSQLPQGVTKRGNSYAVESRFGGKHIYIGGFSTPESAFLIYKKAKEQYIKELAEKYYKEDKITERVYLALLAYKVEITD